MLVDLQRAPERNLKPEQGTHALLRAHPDTATHQLDQAFADRQAESRTAVFPGRRRIGLGERLKKLARRRRRHTHTRVTHHEKQIDDTSPGTLVDHLDTDTTFIGELDRIADQVDQYLAQPDRIPGHEQRHIVLNDGRDTQAFAFGTLGHQRGNRLDDITQIQVDGFEFELTRLDLGEIQYVVDDSQQMARGAERGIDMLVLLLLQFCFPQHLQNGKNAVQRRSDLVADGGEKLGFRHVGNLGLIARHRQLVLHRITRMDCIRQRVTGLLQLLADPGQLLADFIEHQRATSQHGTRYKRQQVRSQYHQ